MASVKRYMSRLENAAAVDGSGGEQLKAQPSSELQVLVGAIEQRAATNPNDIKESEWDRAADLFAELDAGDDSLDFVPPDPTPATLNGMRKPKQGQGASLKAPSSLSRLLREAFAEMRDEEKT